jgi:hypothetical protein
VVSEIGDGGQCCSFLTAMLNMGQVAELNTWCQLTYSLQCNKFHFTCDAVEKKVPANFPDSAPVAHNLPVASKRLSNCVYVY